ncbi:MAG: helix-turn-helix transcriptional regulator [Salinivirgaceae bacterium]
MGIILQTKEWKMALHNLKLSQEGYFKRLKEAYPKLTNNDIRLCSYLRMNFTSKEIAQLLNISTRAVEISRYRLRKKLSLEHNINLTDFLMQDEL